MSKQITNVVLEGKGPVTLRPSDHVATGGEGSIYRIGDMSVKVYLDPLKMRQQGMPEKFKLLKQLKHPYVVAPQGLVTIPSGEPVGLYMPFIEGHPLSRVFTNDFWQKEQFDISHNSTLVDRMREVVKFAHQQNALLVDANELNWFMLMQKKSPEPRVIDVDSWAIGKWPATVIMPSIRDWHAKVFDRRTDWFAWGVVTFQLYTGLHPYKGTLDGFDRGDLTGRMKANASVFAQGVRLNRAVRDFSNIPGPLLNWYEATFQKGERTAPPSPFDTGITAPRAAQVTRVVTTSKTGLLVFEKLISNVTDSAIRVFHCGVVLTASGSLIDLATKRQIGKAISKECEVIRNDNGWLIADWSSQGIKFTHVEEGSLKEETLPFKLNGKRFLRYENRLFLVTDQGLTELKMHFFGKPLLSAGQTWGVMVNSTKWFDGLGVQSAMGAMFIIVPFGDGSVAQQRVPELDGMQAVAGVAGNRFVSIVGLDKKTGTYRKVELTFDRDYKSYKVWETKNDGPELNMAILPKGVCASIVQDGQLLITVPTTGQTIQVDDRSIATDMLLGNWGDKVVYIQKGEVWSVKMK